MKALTFIRDRYHPLYHLRRFALFQKATRWLDVPIAIRFPDIAHPVYVSLSKNLSFVISGGTVIEEQERKNFSRLVKAGSFRRFFDVGANIGPYGFMFQTIVEDGATVMFEPDEDNAGLIRHTLAGTAASGIELVQASASDADGILTFYKDELSGSTGSIEGSGDSFVAVHHKYEPRAVRVRSLTLDGAAGLHGNPDLIKIDVEGAELNVLRGAEKLIERAQPAIFFECDRNQEQVRSFLAARGYVFLDFSSMRPVLTLTHNNLALHRVKHAHLVGGFTRDL
jgi:FkbM family methyltransferase